MALRHICEDSGEKLVDDAIGRPIDQLVPRSVLVTREPTLRNTLAQRLPHSSHVTDPTHPAHPTHPTPL